MIRFKALIVLLLCLGVVACGGPAAPVAPAPSVSPAQPVSRLPPRPAELRLDQVNPCGLLTEIQRAKLGVNQGKLSSDGFGLHYSVCQWSTPLSLHLSWYLVRLRTQDGADEALDSKLGSQVVQVGGFAAVQTSGSGLDPDKHCVILVDVAPHQSLWAQYYAQGEYPGLTHARSCQLAQEAAEKMVATLRAAPPR